MVAPVLPPAPVKLPTPVTPPVVKKNETPVKPSGPKVNKSKIDYTDPDSFIPFDASGDGDRFGRPNYWYTEDKKLGTHLDEAAKAFSSNPALRKRYDELLVAAGNFNGPEKAKTKVNKRTAALNMYRELRDIKGSGIDDVSAAKLLQVRKEAELLDLRSNLKRQREAFISQYVNNGNVSDRVLYNVIGSDLAGLTPEQRDTYITLLPGWTGTHKELATAAKSL